MKVTRAEPEYIPLTINPESRHEEMMLRVVLSKSSAISHLIQEAHGLSDIERNELHDMLDDLYHQMVAADAAR